MNKEMVHLNDNIVGIYDEYGNLTKRVYEDNIKQILENENKLENITNIIMNLKSKINECKKFEYNCNKLSKFLIILILLHIVITLLLGSTLFMSLIGALGFAGLSSGIIMFVKKKMKN